MLDACATLLQGFALDWQATVRLFQLPGFGRTVIELNPIIRAVGPDPYFSFLMVWTARHCGDLPWWVTVGQWAAQTWALNTHLVLGTASQVPYLVFNFALP